MQAFPPAQGLYDGAHEHDACGVAFVATMTGVPSHAIVSQALTALRNLEHRGAAGAEPNSGDGAGILMQVPDTFFREVVDFTLPAKHAYAVGTAFVPGDDEQVAKTRKRIEEIAAEEGLTVLGWREVPTDPSSLGRTALDCMPSFVQLFVSATGSRIIGMGLERLAFVLRKRAEHETDAYFPSLSSRTIAYKGMLTTEQLDHVFPDLVDERVESAIAVVHSRFSTNTFPSWPLSHPFRFIAHNGEINTVMGNRNWMRAREALLKSDLIPGDLDRIFPICTPGASDSASFDEVLEILHLGGRSLPHSVLMMIPEAWENHNEMDPKRRAFYEFHSALMEPWDGPACVVFTDGTQVGAVLDRNGLRPSRYWVTDDDLVVLASEVGVLDIPQDKVVRKGRLQPGRMFLVDTEEHRIIEDGEIKEELATEHPYDEWLHAGLIKLADIADREHVIHSHASVTRRQQIFGYTEEELRLLLTPMANSAAEPIGSMGTDTPIAVLSDRSRLLFDYFAQLFAQVTNPPLDAIREELVTSLNGTIGPEANLLDPTPASCRQVVLPFPVITNDELVKIRHINRDGDMPGFITHVSRGLYDVSGWRRRPGRTPRRDLQGGQPGDLQRRARDRALRPPRRRDQGADPVAADDRSRAPPPGPGEDPHPGRPDHRGRRRPRGAPRRAADRLRRRGGQPLPGDGDGRGPRPRRLLRQAGAREGRRQPGQVAGQGRAQGDVEDGRLARSRPTPAPRSSRRSGSPRSWSTSTSPAPPPSSAAWAST